jgi:hypothetical protein
LNPERDRRYVDAVPGADLATTLDERRKAAGGSRDEW